MTDSAGHRARDLAVSRPMPDVQTFDVADLGRVIRRHLVVLIAVPAVLGVATLAWTLLTPRTWTSTASFLPKGAQTGGAVGSDLAARFGISLGGGDPGSSPAFYSRLLQSRAVLTEAAGATYEYLADGRRSRATLDRIFEIEEPNADRRRALVVEALKSRIDVTTDPQTGFVLVSFEAPDPVLAQNVTAKLIELVNEFNLRNRQSQAGMERRFIQERLTTVRGELQTAIARLQSFLQQNATYGSPQLMLQREQLQQEVSARQALVTTLSQAFENARINEVRDTPVITVLETADLPVRPNSRGTVLKLLLAGILGVLLATAWVLWKEFLRHPSATNQI